MADIFISYSQRDRASAQHLAAVLQDWGFTVWWDAQIAGGETFRDAISAQLDAARVVVVLWSADSASSRFVVDEADQAAAEGKLVSVLLSSFAANKVPLGFRSFHAVAADDLNAVEGALKRRGLEKRAHHGAADVVPLTDKQREEEAWRFVLAKRDKRLVEKFLTEFPNSAYRTLAEERSTLVEQDNSNMGVVLLFAIFGAGVSCYFFGINYLAALLGALLGIVPGCAFVVLFMRAVEPALQAQESRVGKHAAEAKDTDMAGR